MGWIEFSGWWLVWPRLRLILAVLFSWLVLLCGCGVQPATAQVQDVQQLLLDIEKLMQFKAIMSDMETGYAVLTQGYGQVKDIAQGNFSLHAAFLDGLMLVSPQVRKYGKIALIIAAQAKLVSEYKAAWKHFGAGGRFSAEELSYINRVFQSLLSRSADNLAALAAVITDSRLRMSDDERLQAIDHIYAEGQEQLVFLRHFNSQVSVLDLQRAKEMNDLGELKQLYGHE
ncbi:MAG: TerB family tellurite resistance protein [Bacteroidota bacterium]